MSPRSGRASSSQIADAQMSFGEWFQQAFSESPRKSSSKKVTASCSASTQPLALKNIPTKPVSVEDTWKAMLSKARRDITKLAKMKDGRKESALPKPIMDKLKKQVAGGQQLVGKLKKWFEAAPRLGPWAKPHVATIKATAKR